MTQLPDCAHLTIGCRQRRRAPELTSSGGIASRECLARLAGDELEVVAGGGRAAHSAGLVGDSLDVGGAVATGHASLVDAAPLLSLRPDGLRRAGRLNIERHTRAAKSVSVCVLQRARGVTKVRSIDDKAPGNGG